MTDFLTIHLIIILILACAVDMNQLYDNNSYYYLYNASSNFN